MTTKTTTIEPRVTAATTTMAKWRTRNVCGTNYILTITNGIPLFFFFLVHKQAQLSIRQSLGIWLWKPSTSAINWTDKYRPLSRESISFHTISYLTSWGTYVNLQFQPQSLCKHYIQESRHAVPSFDHAFFTSKLQPESFNTRNHKVLRLTTHLKC